MTFETYDLEVKGLRLPEVELTESDLRQANIKEASSPEEFLRCLSEEGLRQKGLAGDKYTDRLNYELDIYEKTGFTDYIILIWDIINFCRKENIPVGRGRGSCPGSLVLYSIGVTGVDPIEYDLYFERFVSETRAKSQIIDGVRYIDGLMAPDVDLDIAHEYRSKVVEYISNKFQGRCCKLSTTATLKGKAVLKECAKIVGNVTNDEAEELSKAVPELFGKVFAIEDAYKESDKIKDYFDGNPKVYKIAKQLQGIIKNKSSHASGYLVAYDDHILNEIIPLELSKDGELVSSFDMNYAQIFCIKIDLLGLQDLSLLAKVCDRIGIDMDELDPEDPSIYEHYKKEMPTPYGLFQIGADCNFRVLNKVKPRNLKELAAVIALARPGALAYVDQFSKFIETGEFESVHEFFDDTLKETGSIPIFQEDLLRAVNHLGFSLGDAENLRRIVGKKDLEKIKQWEAKITDKVIERGLDPKIADVLWKVASESANYSFNKCIFEEEEVITKSGKKQLRNVVVGDFVKSLNQTTGDIHFVEVLEVFRNEVETYEVVLDNGRRIRTSMDHKFLTKEGMLRLEEAIVNRSEIVCLGGSSEIFSVERSGIQNTVDLHVNHTDHNFYCNGIVVSNSHALSYATLSALSTYAKFKYPQDFYIECLNAAEQKGNNREEISLINKELVHFGIKILPPDLSKSNLEFSKEGNNIRYGLSSIKGIAAKSVEALEQFASRERNNKLQVFHAAKDSGLNIGITSALIQAGTLDSLLKEGETRTSLVYEAQLYSLLTDREKVYALQHGHEYDFNVFNLIKSLNDWKTDEGKPLARKTRLGTIKKNAEPYRQIYRQNGEFPLFANYAYEKALLGYSHSTTLREVCRTAHSGTLFSAKQFAESDEYFYHICGEILEIKYQKSKAGKQYLKILIEDETGDVNCMMFEPDVFAFIQGKVYPELREGSRVIISGKKWNDALIISAVRFLDEKIFLKMSDLKG